MDNMKRRSLIVFGLLLQGVFISSCTCKCIHCNGSGIFPYNAAGSSPYGICKEAYESGNWQSSTGYNWDTYVENGKVNGCTCE